jgi:uncharacterized membrane protein
MRIIFIIIICCSFVLTLSADNKTPADSVTSILKIESNWTNTNELNTNVESKTSNKINIITIVDGITYYTSNEGIYITLKTSTNNVKLYSLTGEVVWKGNLVQGSFLIPIKQGLYFLRINNKSYKVVRK